MVELYVEPVLATTNAVIASSDHNAGVRGTMRWIRQWFSADPPGANYWLQSSSGTAAGWVDRATAVLAALGYTPVNKAGDSMSSNLQFTVNGAGPTFHRGGKIADYDDISGTGVQAGDNVFDVRTEDFSSSILRAAFADSQPTFKASNIWHAASAPTFAGALAALSGTFTNAVTAASATIAGALSAGSAAISGGLNAVTGAFSSDVSVGGTLGVTGAQTNSSTIQGTRLISTQATGTAPLTVSSTTQVPNLNASQVVGRAPGTGSGDLPILDANGRVPDAALLLDQSWHAGLEANGAILTLSTTPTDVTGATITIDRAGTWLIVASAILSADSAAGGANCIVTINGVDDNHVMFVVGSSASADAATCGYTNIVTGMTVGMIVKLRGVKGSAGGAAEIGANRLNGIWLAP